MMNNVVFHIDETKIPSIDQPNTIHVHLFGARPPRLGTASIGGKLEFAVKRLGVVIDRNAFDFLSIALAVVAADTFVNREKHSANGWAREFGLDIPLAYPEVWRDVASNLERALSFLSGDRWTLSFREGGVAPPNREAVLRRYRYAAVLRV